MQDELDELQKKLDTVTADNDSIRAELEKAVAALSIREATADED